MVENQTGKKIKILRTDNGGEFCEKELSFLKFSTVQRNENETKEKRTKWCKKTKKMMLVRYENFIKR